MIKGYTVSVVIPAYNEEKTVGGVVGALVASEKIDEIICVDDGSTDKTYDALREFGSKIKLIHYLKNKGKGYALYRGVKTCFGEIVVFCDSDLLNLSKDDIIKMVNALVSGKNKMVLGCPESGTVGGIYARSLVGERAFFKSDLIPFLDHFKASRLGVETYLNHVFPKWTMVKLKAYHLEKFEKMKPKDAFISYIKEAIEIAREYAKLEGILNEKVEKQLRSMKKAKTWKQLGMKVKRVGNLKVRNIFEKYILSYSQKIKSFFAG